MKVTTNVEHLTVQIVYAKERLVDRLVLIIQSALLDWVVFHLTTNPIKLYVTHLKEME